MGNYQHDCCQRNNREHRTKQEITLFHSQQIIYTAIYLRVTCSFDELNRNFCIQTKQKLFARIFQLPYKQHFVHQGFTIELSNEQCTMSSRSTSLEHNEIRV